MVRALPRTRGRGQHRRLQTIALSGAVLAGVSAAKALDKGQQWFVDNGLQLMGVIGDPSRGVGFHLSTYQSLGYTSELWEWHTDASQLTMSWGRWVGSSSDMPPQGSESSHMSTLKQLSLGDEPNLNDSGVRDTYVSWYNSAHGNSTYDNVLLWNNNWGGQITDANLGDFITRAHPDMISFDTYPYAPSAQPAGGSPTSWYSDLRRYREWGIDTNTPVGVYRQTYASASGSPQTRAVSESELALQTSAALAFNAKSLEDFTYNFNNTTLFSGGSGDSTLSSLGTSAQTINAEAKKLGPTLVRLKPVSDWASDHTTSVMFLRGKHTNSSTYNSIPIGFVADGASNAYTDWNYTSNDPYLVGFSASNDGTLNSSLPGDVILSWFQPLDESYDGAYTDEKYLMVTNGLADMSGTSAQTSQTINLDFKFLSSGITQLERINQSTGAVEDVSLTNIGGGKLRYTLTLGGGESDLFKFKDGAPFIGLEAPDNTMYWDSDGSASGNSTATGANMGGAGTWNTSTNWYNGVTEAAWASDADAVFWGTAGSVTLSGAKSANSLKFKTDGYSISGSTLTMTGSSLTADAGVTATISSVIDGTVGLVKNGAGTINLAHNNGFSGHTVINAGELGIISGANGVNPPSPQIDITINNGATLRFNQNSLALTANRNILLGTGGGVIATDYTNTINGVISGAQLTKTGSGTLILAGNNTYSSTTISAGTLQVGTGGTGGALAGPVVDNGILRFNRSDSNGFTALISGSGALVKEGGGTLTLSNTNTYAGGTTVNDGTLVIGNGSSGTIQGNITANSGGTFTVASGGRIDAGTISIPTGGTVNRTGGVFNFDAINQTGGTFNHSVANQLLVAASGGATYTLSSGSLTTSSGYALWIGATGSYTSGDGTLTQSGGTLSTNRLELGHTTGTTGTVNLSGTGQISASNIYVGGSNSAGAGTGVMNITGGTVTLSGWLHIWNTGAAAPGGTRVNFSGGTVSVYGLNTHRNTARWNWTGGTFNLGAGGWTHVVTQDGATAPSAQSFSVGPDGPMGSALDLWKGKNLVLRQTSLNVALAGEMNVTGGSLIAPSGMRNNGSFVQTGGSSTLGAVSGDGSMSVSGGDLMANSIAQHALDISGGATVHIVAGAGASAINDLRISRGSALDLGNNALILRGNSISQIMMLLGDGRIATGAGDPGTALVVADNGLLGLGDFLGQSGLSDEDILVRNTWLGDADLNGEIDFVDFTRFADAFANGGPANWTSGDFDDNGAVNGMDFEQIVAGLNAQGERISSAFQHGLSSFATTNDLPLNLSSTVTPEPGSLALLAGAALLMRRRRRKERVTG
jgi:autotransporter-associated beta strand protein